MKKFAVLAMMLLVPAFAANAAGVRHDRQAALKYHKRPVSSEHKHGVSADRSRQDEKTPGAPPVTRLPVAPDTFRA